jgi:NAD(P)-dependent dehydrogenase (short-subunit alcohol dehydrogenase family)
VTRLREAGAKVLSTAHSPVRATADAMFVAADPRSAEGCAIVAEAVDKNLGEVDIIVHVVGGSSSPAAGAFLVLDENERQKELNPNLLQAVRLDRAPPAANASA